MDWVRRASCGYAQDSLVQNLPRKDRGSESPRCRPTGGCSETVGQSADDTKEAHYNARPCRTEKKPEASGYAGRNEKAG